MSNITYRAYLMRIRKLSCLQMAVVTAPICNYYRIYYIYILSKLYCISVSVNPILEPCNRPLLLGTARTISVMKKLYRFLLQRGVPLRDVTTIDTLVGSRDLAFLGLSPIVSRAHRARQRQTHKRTPLYKYGG
jgi:hypothetical protein